MRIKNVKKRCGLLMLIICTALMVCMLAGCADKAAEQSQTENDQLQQTVAQTEPVPVDVLEVLSTEEQGDTVVVTTSYCILKYPYAFSDLIRIQTVAESGREALAFTMGDGEYPLFTLWFGGEEGILLGKLILPATGAEVEVLAEVFSADETLDGSELNSYHAAQECFNDVISALAENENFITTG